MSRPALQIASCIALFASAFTIIATAIFLQPKKSLSDFDQSFYLTIAYDLDRRGVFSNGVFDDSDPTHAAPAPGMFFVPGYPLIVLAAMKLDARFDKAVACSVAANRSDSNKPDCDAYAAPILILHALMLALGVVSIALAGGLIFGGTPMFWLTGTLATGALAAEADIFSFVMTEAMTVSLYCLSALFAALAWKTSRIRHLLLAGFFLGLLCLTRPSFVIVIPAVMLLIFLFERRHTPGAWRRTLGRPLLFAAACLLVLAPWIARNYVSVGKLGLTEEYGSAALIERFAYNDMTAREFFAAFPYCTPGLGDVLFDQVYGKDSMHRFVYHTRDSFFHIGRGKRDALVKEYGRLDPLIRGIVLDEMRRNWWRHLLISIPLGWCGMWAGWIWGLLLIPLFCWACVLAVRESQPLLLAFAAPPILMLGLHAAVANQYTRYNLILIAPLAVGAAWIISRWFANARSRSRACAPAP